MITNGIVFEIRWPKPDVQERRGHDSVEAIWLARLDPVLVELVVGDHVHHLDRPHQGHQGEQDLCGVTHRLEPYPWPPMATAPDQKPSIAPIVGPDDERRFTDSGIEIKHRYDADDVEPNLDERLGEPGEYPYTRGIHPDMYRGRKWTMRQYAGYASAKETNERFHYLIDHGSTGLSMAFDLPTQLGRDSDDPLCMGEVGRTGVAIDTIDDMRRVFDGIPLDQVSTSMTINAPAAVLLLLYELVGEEQGVAAEQLTGTTQNDVLKEYIARGNFIYPPGPGDAPHHGPVRLLPRAHPEVEHDLDLRLPHAREGLLGGAGGGLHARQRDRLRAGRDRRRPPGGRVRAAARLLLQRPQQRLPGGGEVPRRAPDVGADHARALRRQGRALAEDALPHADGRRDPRRAAAAQQHRARGAPGLRGRGRRHPVASHERLRRGAGAAERDRRAHRAPHPADPRPRVGRRRHRRPVRRARTSSRPSPTRSRRRRRR